MTPLRSTSRTHRPATARRVLATVDPSTAPAPVPEPTTSPAAAPSDAVQASAAGGEPAPGSAEALALLAELGIAPRPAAGEPLGPDDERFSPIAIGHLTHRLVEVKLMLDQLAGEQKELHETLRLAHLRGDLLHLRPSDPEASGYQLPEGPLLHRRSGRKQWRYSAITSELEAQLKARQTYEQATGEATWRHGPAFWELRFARS